MKKKNIITIAALAAAGIAGYLIRKKMSDRNREKSEPSSGSNSRHMTDVFSKAKSTAQGPPATP